MKGWIWLRRFNLTAWVLIKLLAWNWPLACCGYVKKYYLLPRWRFSRWRPRIHRLALDPQILRHAQQPPRAWMRNWRTLNFISGLRWPSRSGSTVTSTKVNSSSKFRQSIMGVVSILTINNYFNWQKTNVFVSERETEMLFVYIKRLRDKRGTKCSVFFPVYVGLPIL